ncbi:MAG: FliM/FliN family flagellar motor switch protein [Chthoniobacteraceae bacterium]
MSDVSDMLNQSAIDQLLASAAEATRFPVFSHAGESIGMTSEIEVAPVDFRNPTFLAEGELRRLRNMHQEYARTLGTRITSFLRMEVGVGVSRFTTQSYEGFLETLKNPTQLSLFRVTGLSGVGILEIPPKLAMAFTNRLLGGRDQSGDQNQYLTEIEIALLEDVIGLITSEWCNLWRDEVPLEASLVAHETNPRFVQACSAKAVMLVLALEVTLGELLEIVQIAVPVLMIDPIVKRLHAARSRENKHSVEESPVWRATYDLITVPLHAEISASEMTVAEVLQMKAGDVISLPQNALEQTRIRVAGALRFTGRTGQQNGKAAVQIQTINPSATK